MNIDARCPDWIAANPAAWSAMETGGNWESLPESADCMEWIPHWCDDCECWHECWHGIGWEVEGGSVVMSEWTCDSDGNWDSDCATLYREDPEYCDTAVDRLLQDSTRAYLRYAEHVAKTGDDPLGQFYVRTRIEGKEKWQVRFRAAIGGAVLVGARRNGRGEWSRGGDGCPRGLLEFLELASRGGNRVFRFGGSMDELRQLAESDDNCDVQRDSRYLKMVVTIDANRPRSESAIRRDLKRAARRSLAIMGRS